MMRKSKKFKKGDSEINFFKYNYSKCLNFLKEFQWYVVFSLALFMFMFLIGFTFPVFFREQILSVIQNIILSLEGKSTLELILHIFLNNLEAGFLALILGIGFGIFPFVATIINGYILGFVSRMVVVEGGIFVLWRIFPHGVFELPAIMLSIGIGLKIGMDLLKKDRKRDLKENLKESIRFFVFVIIPLLIIAAIIEGTLIGIGA